MNPHESFTYRTLGLLLGMIFGLIVLPPSVYAQAQDGTQTNPFLVTQTGGWNHTVQCDVSNVVLTISIDGSVAVPAAGVTWSGAAAPYTATIPQSQMPAAARTIGPHSIAITNPAVTIQLADGTNYIYPAGTLTSYFKVLPDTPQPNPPRNPKWIKIIGTIAALVGLGWITWVAAH